MHEVFRASFELDDKGNWTRDNVIELFWKVGICTNYEGFCDLGPIAGMPFPNSGQLEGLLYCGSELFVLGAGACLIDKDPIAFGMYRNLPTRASAHTKVMEAQHVGNMRGYVDHLMGRRLACYCQPEACHGHVLREVFLGTA